jgi:hypothetical protein
MGIGELPTAIPLDHSTHQGETTHHPPSTTTWEKPEPMQRSVRFLQRFQWDFGRNAEASPLSTSEYLTTRLTCLSGASATSPQWKRIQCCNN